jgi:hypothetical protein
METPNLTKEDRQLVCWSMCIIPPREESTHASYKAGGGEGAHRTLLQIASPAAVRRIHRVQTVTIASMSAEALLSLFAAWRARSPALLAFGGDSTIELFSAVVVL